MSNSTENGFMIHVSLIDEFLASRLAEGDGGPLAFSVRQEGRDGDISLTPIEGNSLPGGAEGVDFELSACECAGLDPEDAGFYIGRPVYTSSAHELFDFLLWNFSSFDCCVEFTGNAWSVRVANPVRG